MWGVEKWIGRCVRSLMEQTYGNIEYVFVNDCTADDSIRIVSEEVARYPERSGSVRIVEHEKNWGVAAARQTGTDAATGDLLMHVDGDDYVSTDMVTKMVAAFENTECDVVECGYVSVYSDTRKEVSALRCSDDAYIRILLCQNVIHNGMWGRLYRRELFERDVNFVEGINYGDDFAVLPRLLCGARRSVVKEPLYYYNCENTGSYTHDLSDRHNRQLIRAWHVVREYFEKHGLSERYKTPLDVCALNVVRHVMRYGGDKASLLKETDYSPRSMVARTLNAMFLCGGMMKITNVLYLAWRKLLIWRWLR